MISVENNVNSRSFIYNVDTSIKRFSHISNINIYFTFIIVSLITKLNTYTQKFVKYTHLNRVCFL